MASHSSWELFLEPPNNIKLVLFFFFSGPLIVPIVRVLKGDLLVVNYIVLFMDYIKNNHYSGFTKVFILLQRSKTPLFSKQENPKVIEILANSAEWIEEGAAKW